MELSEAKRWLLGGYAHGHVNNLPYAIATEMAFAYRFKAERLYELGYINRLVDDVKDLLPTALEMAAHLMTLPPASRVNTPRSCAPCAPASVPSSANSVTC